MTCTIKFYLRIDVEEHRKGFPVYCRITCQRKKAPFATGEYCKAANWESRMGMPIKDPRLKERLIDIEKKLNDIIRRLEFDDRTISAKLVRDIYKEKDGGGKGLKLMAYMMEYIRQISVRKEDYSEGTVRHYKTTQKHLVKFLQTRNEEDILIQNFSRAHVEALDEFFVTVPTAQYHRPMGRNTANKYHTKLKTVLLNAVRKKVIAENPYVGFALKNKAVDRKYLSREDLTALEEHSLGDNKALQRVRDIFLWTCYRGLRFSDAMSLKQEDILKDADGKYWLFIEQKKTRADIHLPLIQKAVALFHQYEEERSITGKVLPQYVNQKVNAYLKVIADLVGITQKLTHHVARHTFATTILLDNDIPIETVQAFLGQKSIKSTMIYAKVSKNKKLAAVKNLDKLL